MRSFVDHLPLAVVIGFFAMYWQPEYGFMLALLADHLQWVSESLCDLISGDVIVETIFRAHSTVFTNEKYELELAPYCGLQRLLLIYR
jgi:hypothetical protein